MRGKWELNEQDLKFWRANARGQIGAMITNKIDIVDLSKENITPYQVDQVLTSMDWVNDGFKEDSEGGFWNYYYHPAEEYRDIIVYCNAYTFELAIYLKQNEDKFDFKSLHKEVMLNEKNS